MRLLVATTNPGKLREIGPMLDGLALELSTLADYPPIDPPEETGKTFADNARFKALYYANGVRHPSDPRGDRAGVRHPSDPSRNLNEIGRSREPSGPNGVRHPSDPRGDRVGVRHPSDPRWVVAEDSGLEIDALGGAPGVESARFGGADSSYPEKFALIYDAFRAHPGAPRTARFVCAIALVENGMVVFEARGTVEGTIAPEPRGEGGFGYDPIFFYPPFGCTLAEAGSRKHTVSHRAAAFTKLREFLRANRR